jgi:hypothetical protein
MALRTPMRRRRLLLITPSSAAAATNSQWWTAVHPQRRRPAHPSPKPLPDQIPIGRRTARQRPAGSFLGGFRTPAPLPLDRSPRAGIRNPSRLRSFAGPRLNPEVRPTYCGPSGVGHSGRLPHSGTHSGPASRFVSFDESFFRQEDRLLRDFGSREPQPAHPAPCKGQSITEFAV